MKKELEQRNYSFAIRAEETEDEAIITGRPIVYNSRTDLGFFDEIIEPGALAKADLTDVRFLVNHDTSKIPLARSRRNNGSSTMQLQVDNYGMAIRVKLDTKNNPEARALYSAVSRGDISGMSFMFGVDSDEWENLDSDHPLRHIRSISNVVEVSAVTFPAYAATEISARSKDALDEARATLNVARSSKKVEKTEDLELLKEKTKLLLRFNPNHGPDGKFAPTGGGGGGAGSGGSGGSGKSTITGGTGKSSRQSTSDIVKAYNEKGRTAAGDMVNDQVDVGGVLMFTNADGSTEMVGKTYNDEYFSLNRNGQGAASSRQNSDDMADQILNASNNGGSCSTYRYAGDLHWEEGKTHEFDSGERSAVIVPSLADNVSATHYATVDGYDVYDLADAPDFFSRVAVKK